MGGSAESVQGQAVARPDAGQYQAAIADDPRAEQRRSAAIIERVRNGIGEVFVHHGVFRKTAVRMVSGEAPVHAEVFHALQTKTADAAGPVQPGHADTVADFETLRAPTQAVHLSDHLMPGNHRLQRRIQFAFHGVQVGVTYAADPHLHPNLTRPCFRVGQFGQLQRTFFHRPTLFQQHGFHGGCPLFNLSATIRFYFDEPS